jgi:hypothetical protein
VPAAKGGQLACPYGDEPPEQGAKVRMLRLRPASGLCCGFFHNYYVKNGDTDQR